MTATQAYDKYLIKAEKNSVNDGISTDKGRFVILYNEHQNRFIENIYERKGNEDIRYIQALLVESKPIKNSGKKNNYYKFELPVDYFNFSNVYAKATKKTCVNKQIDLYEIKDTSRNYILSDEFTSPSFEYREAPFTFSDNMIKVFTSDFEVDSIILSYYRYPKQITQVDPENPESELNDSFELDFDDKVIDRIISDTVSGFDINNNSERFQLHKAVSQAK